MHYSHQIIDPDMSKATRNSKKDNHSKTDGFYITCPLIQHIIGFKKLRQTVVYKSISTGYGGDQKQTSFLDTMENYYLTVKSININQISNINQNVRKKYRQHYRIDIKQYFKRAYLKQAYEIPIQVLQVLRVTSSKNKQNKLTMAQSDWKTQRIQICKPYYLHGHLRNLLDNSSKDIPKQVLKINRVPKLIRQLLKCSVQFGGLDNFIMTSENVYLMQNMLELQINYTSFAGLSLIKAKSTIGPLQYVQICPYLTANMLLNGEIGVQEKIRFFLINCLSIISKQNFILNMQQVESTKQFNYGEVKKFILSNNQISQRISKQFQQKINRSRTQKRLAKLQESKIKIRELLIDGLVHNKPLTWELVVSSICTGQTKPQNEKSEQYNHKIQKAFRQFHQTLFREDERQQFYKERNLQSALLYIPIRFNANLSLVFEEKAWWNMFNIRDKTGQVKPQFYNFQNLQFCIRLLNAALLRYQLSEATVEKAIQFKNDFVVQTILQYLQLDSLLCISKSNAAEGVYNLNEIMEKYRNMKK